MLKRLENRSLAATCGKAVGESWRAVVSRPLAAERLCFAIRQKFSMILTDFNKDLATLATLMQSGKVTPVIDRRYKLSETAVALRYLEAGHARGKVVLTVE
jgi:NADPH:quinone reductase-like Zn-dependent oxidoreductase